MFERCVVRGRECRTMPDTTRGLSSFSVQQLVRRPPLSEAVGATRARARRARGAARQKRYAGPSLAVRMSAAWAVRPARAHRTTQPPRSSHGDGRDRVNSSPRQTNLQTT
eukprot:6861190-Prymnesium_polylepis.1